MSLRLLLHSLPVSLFLLRCAGWLVPGRDKNTTKPTAVHTAKEKEQRDAEPVRRILRDSERGLCHLNQKAS